MTCSSSVLTARQDVINCAWSSIQSLIRNDATAFEPLSRDIREAVKPLFREIVDTGFKAGLLWTGMTRYPTGGTMGDAQEEAETAFSIVRYIHLSDINRILKEFQGV